MRHRLFAVLLGIFVAAMGLAAAQTGNRDVFAVPEVPVFAEADTAAEAQRIAQEQGRRRAMDLLLRRLTAESDWDYLPSLAAGTPASAEPESVPDDLPPDLIFGEAYDPSARLPVMITPQDVSRYEEGFSIFDEKTSSRTYRARITYRFKPGAVRQLLERSGLPYSESQARRALVLPVLETDDGLYLWESRNPWARAWLARPLVNELTPLQLPRGDQQDIGSASVEAVMALDRVVLKPLADRYETPQVIVAHGRLQRDGDEFRLNVRLIDAYRLTRAAGRPTGPETIALSPDEAAALYDDEDGFGAEGVGEAGTSSATAEVLTETFFRGPNNDFPALAQRAVESTVARHAREWKSRTLIDHSMERTLTLYAWYGDVEEAADIRIALERSPLTRGMETRAFTNENAVFEMTVIGAQEQLVLAMAQENLSVWQSPDGRWNIASDTRAAQLRRDGIAARSDIGGGARRGIVSSDGEPARASGRGIFGRRQPRDAGAGANEIPELPDDLFGDAPGDDGGAPVRLEGSGGGSPVVLEPAGPSEDAQDTLQEEGIR